MRMRVVLGFLLIFCIQNVSLHAKNKGLSNCGNSCYFNSSMQAMSHLTDFNILTKTIPNKNDEIELYNGMMARLPGEGYISSGFVVINGKTLEDCYHHFAQKFFGLPEFIYPTQEELKKDYDDLVKSVGQAEMPSFKEYFKDNNKPITYYQQEDAAEFITKMINFILEYGNVDALKNMVQAEVDSVLNKPAHKKCPLLARTSNSYSDSFKIPISAKPGDVTILNCLNSYFKPENVDVRCLNCDKDITASKYFKISRPPKYLILSLNRFISADGETYKDETPVLFTDLLVLNSFFSDELLQKIKNSELTYRLKAFIVHRGKYGHGHYWAYGFDGKNWNIYEDENIYVVSQADIEMVFMTGIGPNFGGGTGEPTPYIFFYELDKKSEEILKMAEPQPKHDPAIKPAQDLLAQKVQNLKSDIKNVEKSIENVQARLAQVKIKLAKN
ncbi:MAG: Ubiquitin carboxyl-terminal hydrolase [candidate division TM6 bacterium GW2011_GWF2_37_49]|nr:MAG: Ubiquitin carboxyl-terminal hydrolase [candidate division TM6 bacterium GW2011_GWF2_37_49]